MAYNVNLTDGTLLVVVPDGQTDLSTTGLALVGRNFPGYGEYINENFVKLQENFARSTEPAVKLVGQLWFDSANRVMKLWNGVAWVGAGSAIKSEQASTNAHYYTFVDTDSGAPELKTGRDKGLSVQPSTGRVAVNKNSAAASVFEVNGSTNRSRTVAAPIATPETVVHVHGEASSAARVLVDGYGGTSAVALRRGNGSDGATVISSNDVIGSLDVYGQTGTGYSVARGGVRVVANGNWSGIAQATKLEFYTTTATTSNTKMTLTSVGDLLVSGDVTAYSASDSRLKTNVVQIGSALEKLKTLNGVTFNWNELAEGKDPVQREVGVIAQQVQSVLPEAVTVRDDGFMAVRYEKLVPLLIEAIKELQNEVEQLRAAR